MATDGDDSVTSIDAVDLNSLPISQRHSDEGAVAISSTSNLDSRRNESNEVVIKADDTEQGLNEPVSKSVTCHYCNINVPVANFKKHKKSSLHIFNREVADNAVKRPQLDENKKYINKNNKKPIHFCAECLIMIDSKDETSHKQSTTHKDSVSLERFLKDFRRFCIKDRNKAVDNTSSCIKTEYVEETKSPEQENFSSEPNAEEMLAKNSSINLDEHKSSSTETVTNEKKEEHETVLLKADTKEKQTLDSIIELINRKSVRETNIKKEKTESRKEDVKETKGIENSVLKTLMSLDGLNTLNNSSANLKKGEIFIKFYVASTVIKFQVAKYYFESIVETGVTCDRCMVCDEIFARDNRLTHVKSKLHIQNMFLKPLNLNCIRKINNSLFNCVLCHDYFTEYELHVNSKMHLTNYRNKLVSKTTEEEEDNCNFNEEKENDNSKENRSLLDVDSESLTDTNKDAAPLNEETKYDITYLALRGSFICLYTYIFPSVDISSNILCDTCNDWVSVKEITKHEIGTKHVYNAISEYHYLLEYIDADNLVCKICKVTVSNVRENILDHCTRSKHTKMCSKLLKAESMSKVDDKIYYCAKCKEYILHKNEYLHIESKKHNGLKEDNDKVDLVDTGATHKGIDDSGRSNDPPDTGDATATAVLVCNTGGEVEGPYNYNLFSSTARKLSGLSKIDAYKMIDRINLKSIFYKTDNSEAMVEELRMIKSLMKHMILLRGQKDV